LAILAIQLAALARMAFLKKENDAATLAELRYVARYTTTRVCGQHMVPRQPHLSSQALGPPG